MIKKVMGKVGSIFATLLIVIEIIAILFLVVSKISGQIPSVFGHQLYVIVSPSMEPEISVGDVILSETYEEGELEIGDVVTYLGRSGDVAGKMITHKIVEIEGETVITQGTANTVADPAIRREDIRSVMKYKTVVLSAVYRVIRTTVGFVCLVLLPLVVMIGWEVVGLIREIKREGGADDEKNTNE